jgi:hypothetical protein
MERLSEPVSADLSAQAFSGLDELDEIDELDKCGDFNYGIYLKKGRNVLMPPCLVYQVNRDGEPSHDAGLMLSINGHIYFLPISQRQVKNGTYYEASDKSVLVLIQINKTDEGPDGTSYFGTLTITVNKKVKRYPITYYRGG